ncbi:hypothetical protein [Streptomyces palmae]|uniref:hypothetical protein n=1 Tax=Streptomyces palmae TaxID=1701085 RepID=UPI001ADF450C|nr:hypothetical protein [Streptomyces palmae]
MTAKSRVWITLRRRQPTTELSLDAQPLRHLDTQRASVPMPVTSQYPREPERCADLLLRFRTRGGAYVDVTGYIYGGTIWRCHGCLCAQSIELRFATSRAEANDHAARCWAIDLVAMPVPTPSTTAKPKSRAARSRDRRSS